MYAIKREDFVKFCFLMFKVFAVFFHLHFNFSLYTFNTPLILADSKE